MLRLTSIVFVLTSLFFSPLLRAQGNWNWVRTTHADAPSATPFMPLYAGVEMWLMSRGGSVNSTNLYVAGMFTNDRVAFGTDTLYNFPTAGWWNTSVAKYDSAGNVLWALCGSQGTSEPMAITTDPFGNLYVYGAFFTDKVRFGPYEITSPYTGSPTLYTTNYSYLLKIDSAGHVKWLKKGGKVGSIAGGVTAWSWGGGGIVSDSKGNIYVSGNYDTTLVIGTSTLTCTNGDAFVAKYDSSGNALWAKRIGGAGQDAMAALAISPQGKLYITGNFDSTLIIGSTTLHSASGRASAFLAQIDTAGNMGWARQSTGSGVANCVTTDKNGNVYIGGDDLDPTLTFGGVTIHSPYGAYMVKYDSTGTALWGKSFNNPIYNMTNRSSTYSLATDDALNVWVTMAFRDSALLSPAKTAYKPTRAQDPVAMVEYSKDGDLRDYTVIPSGGDDNSTVFINNGLVYFMTSVFADTTVIGTDTIFSHSHQDQFMLGRYNRCTSCIAGIESMSPQADELSIYPNPASDICIIKSSKALPADTRADIYDINGRIIKSVALSGTSTTIATDGLPGGSYLLRVTTRDGIVAIKKLIIIR